MLRCSKFRHSFSELSILQVSHKVFYQGRFFVIVRRGYFWVARHHVFHFLSRFLFINVFGEQIHLHQQLQCAIGMVSCAVERLQISRSLFFPWNIQRFVFFGNCILQGFQQSFKFFDARLFTKFNNLCGELVMLHVVKRMFTDFDYFHCVFIL